MKYYMLQAATNHLHWTWATYQCFIKVIQDFTSCYNLYIIILWWLFLKSESADIHPHNVVAMYCRYWGTWSKILLSFFFSPDLFLPIFSWSLTTQCSSAPESRGIPFRSHSKPWRDQDRRQLTWVEIITDGRMMDLSFVCRLYLVPNGVRVVLDDLRLLLWPWKIRWTLRVSLPNRQLSYIEVNCSVANEP